ncbi:hypothetical protein L228DRAFT_246501 [Xylona heveae TC161]|uniref:Uncharacterized protein n=1 Tax=Xylona heveae (strain CBS 132557 / TC161) TaxID=1328760 RepID=A0A165HKX3_XYLHT|nr:hypothetical protein L228DRAFT_246501 [Xylona heveae TC161]KZF23669.1 hypothetical protein L228DRAFT_246501 [Xylona heveae TC161]
MSTAWAAGPTKSKDSPSVFPLLFFHLLALEFFVMRPRLLPSQAPAPSPCRTRPITDARERKKDSSIYQQYLARGTHVPE